MNRGEEQQRILELVESGKVTPEEGERLLASLEQRSRGRQQCPFCAESIPAEIDPCPECGSALGASHVLSPAPQNESGFHALGGLAKFLVCYLFLICGIQFIPPWNITAVLLAALGIVAAVLICKGSRSGWILGILWAGVQIIPIVVGSTIFNLVGVILLILFIKAAPRDPKPKLHERS